jgi:hypothetical protein
VLTAIIHFARLIQHLCPKGCTRSGRYLSGARAGHVAFLCPIIVNAPLTSDKTHRWRGKAFLMRPQERPRPLPAGAKPDRTGLS